MSIHDYNITASGFKKDTFVGEIQKLSTRTLGDRFLKIDKDKGLTKTNVFVVVYEKLREVFSKLTSNKHHHNPTDSVIVRYRVLQILSQGTKEEWISNYDAISALAIRAGLYSPNMKNSDSGTIDNQIQKIFKDFLTPTSIQSKSGSEELHRTRMTQFGRNLKALTEDFAREHRITLGDGREGQIIKKIGKEVVGKKSPSSSNKPLSLSTRVEQRTAALPPKKPPVQGAIINGLLKVNGTDERSIIKSLQDVQDKSAITKIEFACDKSLINDACLIALSSFPNLTHLDLWECHNITTAVLSSLKGMKKLTALILPERYKIPEPPTSDPQTRKISKEKLQSWRAQLNNAYALRKEIFRLPQTIPDAYDMWKGDWLNQKNLVSYHELLKRKYPDLEVARALSSPGVDKAPIVIGQDFLKNTLDNFPDKNIVAIPVNISDPGRHWTLIIVDRKKRTIEYYDSKVNYAKNHREMINDLGKAAELLGQPPYRVIAKIEKELQPDSNQCGPWTLHFLEERLKNPAVDFNELDIPRSQDMISNYRCNVQRVILQESGIQKIGNKLLPKFRKCKVFLSEKLSAAEVVKLENDILRPDTNTQFLNGVETFRKFLLANSEQIKERLGKVEFDELCTTMKELEDVSAEAR